MRFIKLAFISALILFIVVWLFSLLVPSPIRISRAIDIAAPADSLVHTLTDLQQWAQWNELVNNPQLANKQFTATGFTSNQLQVTVQQVKDDTLLTSWKQQSGRIVTGGFTWHGSSDRLVLQWYFDIYLRWYPWEKFSGLIFDKQLGLPMEKSLDNLKKLLEEKP